LLLLCATGLLSCISRSGVTVAELRGAAGGSHGSANVDDACPAFSSWCGELRLASDFTKAYTYGDSDSYLCQLIFAAILWVKL